MKEGNTVITTSKKIDQSPWKKKKIMELLGIYRTKFFEKLRHNDWDEREVALLKKNGVIE